MKDLFEYLRVQLNLDYISDLTLNENIEKVESLIKTIDYEQFSKKQWEDLSEYLNKTCQKKY